MKYLPILCFFLIASLSGFCQSVNLTNDKWVEIRSEFDNGTIFKIDGKFIRRAEPRLILDFSVKDSVLVNDQLWQNNAPDRIPLKYEADQPLINFNKVSPLFYVIDKQSNNMLVLKKQLSNAGNGSRKYFLPKKVFDGLSKSAKDSLKGSWLQDERIYDSLVKVDILYFKMTEVWPQGPLDDYGYPNKNGKTSDLIKARLQAKKISFSDTMSISFIVELTGKLSHISISENNDKQLLAAITEILNEMGRWLPAKQNGTFVRSSTMFKVTK